MAITSLNTKANLNIRTTYETTISHADIVNHLTNEVLKLPVQVSNRRLAGPNPEHGYVITYLAIRDEDLLVDTKPTNFADKAIYSFGNNAMMKTEILDLIKPFKFPSPEQIELAMRDRRIAETYYNLGLWGDNLKEIFTFNNFRHDSKSGHSVIILDTELIVKDMVTDPLTGKIEGSLSISEGHGAKDDNLRWECVIKTGKGVTTSYSGITIDRIISNARG